MKRVQRMMVYVATAVVVGLVAWVSTAPVTRAADTAKKAEGGGAAATEPTDVTVTGEVVDIACYMMGGAKGEGHKGCAAACAKGGIPLALLDGDGKLYLLLADGEPHKTMNEKLLADGLVAAQVKVMGKLHSKPGLNLIVVEKCEKAGA